MTDKRIVEGRMELELPRLVGEARGSAVTSAAGEATGSAEATARGGKIVSASGDAAGESAG